MKTITSYLGSVRQLLSSRHSWLITKSAPDDKASRNLPLIPKSLIYEEKDHVHAQYETSKTQPSIYTVLARAREKLRNYGLKLSTGSKRLCFEISKCSFNMLETHLIATRKCRGCGLLLKVTLMNMKMAPTLWRWFHYDKLWNIFCYSLICHIFIYSLLVFMRIALISIFWISQFSATENLRNFSKSVITKFSWKLKTVSTLLRIKTLLRLEFM